MFVILTYDVSVRRAHKVLKTCRRYLTHTQKSVFEGVLSFSELERLKADLEKVIIVSEDSVQIYKFESLRFGSKERIGLNTQNEHIL